MKTAPSFTANCMFIRPTTFALGQQSSTLDFFDDVFRHIPVARSRRVTGMDTGFLDMLHDTGNMNLGAIGKTSTSTSTALRRKLANQYGFYLRP